MPEPRPHNPGAGSHLPALAAILLVYAAMTLPLLTDWPPAWPDESHFGEPASVLARTGQLRSEFIPAFHEQVTWQPPLYFSVLAPVIGMVGEDPGALRMFSTALGAVIVLLTYAFGTRVTGDRRVAVLASLLLALDPNFTTYIKLVRMDGMCVLLQMTALFLLLAWSVNRRWFLLGGAGLSTGAAVLTHPLGLVGLVIGCAFVVALQGISTRERIVALGILALPAIVLLAAWILAIVPDLTRMAEQLRFQFARKARPPWESAVNFISRYRSIPVFLLFVIAALVVWVKHRLPGRTPGHTLIGFAAAATSVAVALTFELPYHVYFLPWVTLCGAIAVLELWTAGSRIARRVIITAVAVLVLNFTGYTMMVYATLHWIEPVPISATALYERVSRHLPVGARVLLQGYPDGYWILRAARPDLRLVGGVAFTPAEKRAVRDGVDYAVIARTFEPAADSVALFTDLRLLLDSGEDRPWSITASEGVALRFHPSAWIVRIHRLPGKGEEHGVE